MGKYLLNRVLYYSSLILNRYPGISIKERNRLEHLKRYTYTQTTIFGKNFNISDSIAFLSSFKEIFYDEIYKFKTNSDSILIIDCGANMGLSIVYFKKVFPTAKILAYEPDPNIFNILNRNIQNQEFNDVILRNEAISYRDSIVNFFMEGGHSGMIVQDELGDNIVPVKSIRLRNTLNQFDEITFLKIDIEGHERYVLPDIAEELKKVEYLFLEYHSFIDKEQLLDETLLIIKKAGFKYYIKESYANEFPFINHALFLNMDLLLNIFCYRV